MVEGEICYEILNGDVQARVELSVHPFATKSEASWRRQVLGGSEEGVGCGGGRGGRFSMPVEDTVPTAGGAWGCVAPALWPLCSCYLSPGRARF